MKQISLGMDASKAFQGIKFEAVKRSDPVGK